VRKRSDLKLTELEIRRNLYKTVTIDELLPWGAENPRYSSFTALGSFDANRKYLHYTRAEGLNGILSTGKIRLTNYQDLSDPKELEVGIQQFQNDFENLLPNFKHAREHFHSGVEFTEKWLPKVLGRASPYVASFSLHHRKHDQTHGSKEQWKNYTDMNGFALVIDAAELNKLRMTQIAHGQYVYKYTRSVNYSDNNDLEVERKKVQELLKDSRKFCALHPEKQLEAAEGVIVPYMIRGKVRALSSEQEFRLVVGVPTSRIPENSIQKKRFVSLFDGQSLLPVEKVIVGPGENQKKRFAQALNFVEKSLYPDIPIVMSGTENRPENSGEKNA